MIKFVIHGNPIPKARHRSCSRNGLAFQYDPQSKEKNSIKKTFIHKIKEFTNGPCSEIALNASNLATNDVFHVDLTFHMPIPKSTPVSQKNLMLWGLVEHNRKPDVSNLIKFYEDAANEVLFPDDSMIVKITSQKKWDLNPRTEISIMSKKQDLTTDTHKILGIYSPSDVTSLLRCLHDLSAIQIQHENKESHLESLGNKDNHRDEYSEKTAKIIHRLAYFHADLLNKVKKACPIKK